MTSNYVDVSQKTTDGIDDLVDAGVKSVGRYYNYGAGSKVLSRDEAQALTSANISIWVVFEYYNNSAKWFNADLGRKDATRALQCAMEIVGQPEGTTIYFAADYDATAKDYSAKIAPYFSAVRSVFARSDGTFPYRIGVYSNGLVCRRLLDDGLVEQAWLSCSSGFAEHASFYASKRWSISQTCGTPPVGDLDTDDDEVNGADFGQFSRVVPLETSHAAALAAQFHGDFIYNSNRTEARAASAAAAPSADADGEQIKNLLDLAGDSASLQAAQRIAAQRLYDYDSEEYPQDGCAITVSVLLQQAAIAVADTFRAFDLCQILIHRGWSRVSLNSAAAGDVGTTCGTVPKHGVDHIYLVLKMVNDDEMIVADNQDVAPHFRFISGKGGKSPTTYFLRAPGRETTV
jgi:hypothetical protein